MVGLNDIDRKPRNMTELQKLWKDNTFHRFNQCFHNSLSGSMT